ncbi:anti-sigma-M factor RsmA, partial [Mycobacterium marinum]
MNEAEDETDTDPALTVELLADLQAGLLDDETAAQVRRRIRTDPQAAATLEALQRVRRDVAQAGTDTSGLGDPPPRLPTRITDAVRSATSGGPTAMHITVSTPPPVIPLS